MPTTPFTLSPTRHDFSAVHASLRGYVERDILAGVSHAVLQGRDLIDVGCTGWADREQHIALRPDHLFRIFSNTKLITSCAVLLLMEAGHLQLDDPVDIWLPQLANRRVLKPGATALDDTEPARGAILIRHLLCHSAGLSYGFLYPGAPLARAYNERQVLNAATPMSDMIDVLADLPLLFHPGTDWAYSVASDVLARVVEIVSGQPFDAFLQERIFGPLGMADTMFVVPPQQAHRLAGYYRGADWHDPLKPGLTRINDTFGSAHAQTLPRLSGGGGLVSSLPDMVALLRSLLPGGPTLLRTDTIAHMMRNQLPPGIHIRFPTVGEAPDKGYGLGGAVTIAPAGDEPDSTPGEFQWGGIAGTQWWISPRANLAAVTMTQRQMGFWHPYFFEFKRLICRAVG